jgi:hypothetical protein
MQYFLTALCSSGIAAEALGMVCANKGLQIGSAVRIITTNFISYSKVDEEKEYVIRQFRRELGSVRANVRAITESHLRDAD